MLLWCNKYFNHFLLRPVMITGLVFLFSMATSAQVYDANIVGELKYSPLLRAAFKKTLKTNPLLLEYIKPKKHELMYWPNYPLTASQIDARNREWERRDKQTFGEEIPGDMTDDIIKNLVSTLLYGRKMPAANIPKF